MSEADAAQQSITRIVVDTENKIILSYEAVNVVFNNINRSRYPEWIVILLVGLSCAAFSRIAGGSITAFGMS